MIKINDLSYSFPQKDLFNKISFTLEEGQHSAFIGTSGSGKSTLIQMIMDPERYMFDGTIELDQHCKMGYVSQFPKHDHTKKITVFEYIGEDYITLRNELESIGTAMETSTEIDVLLEKYQHALDAFNAIGGDDYESNINKKLNLANLSKIKDMSVSMISGGEFKLIQVIKEMLKQPDLMFMDEPDVFLDFENLGALKNLINAHKGILLVVTHNRYLLNHCFDKILHLENTELQEFDGGYIEYNLTLLQKKIELQELAIADDEEIERNDQMIHKLRLIATSNAEASRGKALYARVKIQERLEARRIKAPFVDIKKPDIELHAAHGLSDTFALKVNDFSISFDELLLENVSFEIGAGEKVALIGSNGTGKTTLFRAIFKNSCDSIDINENASVAYLSQVQGEMLCESNSVLEEFFDIGFKSSGEIRSHVARYGFNEDVLDRKIRTLSGGEKNILQIAKISAQKSDLLLLDEPTSHLDTYSQMALEKAIENYTGAILMISHDYYTIANCMDYVLIIEDKTIRKMSIRKFRKMIYNSHFEKDYLELEQKKKSIETKIELALKETDFELAKVFAEELETLVDLIQKSK
ncbi:MAG: ATP-binding cassette domain-containing protein [Bacillota bacterium]|nr:ATP-binding cassette domain-containing protein [Bacillota bacterium]